MAAHDICGHCSETGAHSHLQAPTTQPLPVFVHKVLIPELCTFTPSSRAVLDTQSKQNALACVVAHLFERIPIQPNRARRMREEAIETTSSSLVILPKLPKECAQTLSAFNAHVGCWSCKMAGVVHGCCLLAMVGIDVGVLMLGCCHGGLCGI
eukprot:scaffold305793_cov24-Tisochrysis_lutea.AAC.1